VFQCQRRTGVAYELFGLEAAQFRQQFAEVGGGFNQGRHGAVGLAEHFFRIFCITLERAAELGPDVAVFDAPEVGVYRAAPAELVEAESPRFHFGTEVGCRALHDVQRGVQLVVERGAEFADAFVLAQHFAHFVFPGQISLFENPCGEAFHLTGDVPPLVVRDAVVHIFQNPVQDGGSKVKAFHDVVYSRMEHFLVVEVHFEIGREAQFVCQVFQDRLEERVDGFHPETVIVVQDMA